MCRSSQMRHNLIESICSALRTWSSVSRVDFGESTLPYCFDSGFSPHIFQASWLSPVFNTPEFLTTFNCLIDEISRNFQWFQEFENLRIWFSTFVKGNHSHMIFLETPLHVNTAWDINNLRTLPPHCLQLHTTWNMGQNLWQDYVHAFSSTVVVPCILSYMYWCQ